MTKILQIGWLINHINLFLIYMGTGKAKIKAPADLTSGGGLTSSEEWGRPTGPHWQMRQSISRISGC